MFVSDRALKFFVPALVFPRVIKLSHIPKYLKY